MRTRLLLLILLCPLLGIAQSSTSPVVVHPSPTSMQFNKYINSPVSESTGVAEITIPLYTIKEGNIEIPIYLSYHTSGIKYEQTSGDVGVGWVLHPGYRISRTIHGSPDEYYEMADPDHVYTFNTNQKSAKDTYLSRFLRQGNQELPYGGTRIDGEFDMFTFSTGSEGGKFYIKNRVSKTIQKINTSVSAISYQQKTDKSIHIFDVKDGKGNLYRYGQNLTNTKNIIENNTSYNHLPIAPSSWMLTDIQDVHGKKITFDYKAYQEYMGVNNYVKVTSGTPVPSLSHIYNDVAPSHYISQDPYDVYWNQKLDKIASENIEIKFFRRSESGILDSLTINTSAGKRIKKIVFSISGGSKHLFLDNLEIHDGWNPKVRRFTFSYINKTMASTNLSADYWDYYKNVYPHAPGLILPKFGDYDYCLGYNKVDVPQTNVYDRNASNNGDAQTFSLNKVGYPTGGYTTYEYEPNKYIGTKDNPLGNIGEKYAGIRVKKITSYAPESDKYMIREFKYGQNEDGIGTILYDIAHYNNFKSEKTVGLSLTTSSNMFYGRAILFNSKPVGEIANSINTNAPVVYSKVTEYLYGMQGSSLQRNEGKIEHQFHLPETATYLPFAVNQSYSGTDALYNYLCPNVSEVLITPIATKYYAVVLPWEKTYPLSTTTYKYAEGTYTAVKKAEYFYSDLNKTTTKGIKVRRFFESGINYSSSTNYYSAGLNSLFEYGQYELRTGDRVLSKKLITTNMDTSPLISEALYTYNEKLQLIKTDEKQSDGSRNVSNVSFPIDFATGTTFLDNMRNNNLLSYPIEQVTYKEIGSTRTILSGETRKYKTGGQGLIDEVLHIQILAPVASASFKFSNRATGVLPPGGTKTAFNMDARYGTKIKYDLYDGNGKPLQYTLASGSSTSYIWDYFGQYPVAEVRNAVRADIAYAGFEADGKGNWSYGGTSVLDPTAPVGKRRYALASGAINKSGLTSSRKYVLEYWVKNVIHPSIAGSGLQLGSPELLYGKDGWALFRRTVTGTSALTISGSSVLIDELRLYPADAQMTSYTYEPLVGMTSITSPSGQTEYYEYDAALRLRAVVDLNGNLLESYCYNYAGQQVDCAPATYSNTAQSGSFTRSNCPAGQTGSQVTYTVPAGTYTSTISQADANAKAQADVNANGQAYANANGTCTAAPTISFSLKKYMGWDGDVDRITFVDNGATVSDIYPDNTQNVETYQVPSLVYDYVDVYLTNPPNMAFTYYLSFVGNGGGLNPCFVLDMQATTTYRLRLYGIDMTGSLNEFWISDYCQ